MIELTRNTGIAHYQLIDGILICRLKSDLIIDERLAQRLVREKAELVMDEIVPLLVLVPEDHLIFEPQALRLLSTREGSPGLCAVGVVATGSLRTLLVNLSSSFAKSIIPMRYFTSRGEARLWLFNYIRDKEEVY